MPSHGQVLQLLLKSPSNFQSYAHSLGEYLNLGFLIFEFSLILGGEEKYGWFGIFGRILYIGSSNIMLITLFGLAFP